MKYREYFDKDLDYLIAEELKYNSSLFLCARYAKSRLRMYANLFCRSIKNQILTTNSFCVKCSKKENLQLDHIIPISNGGKNELSNIQILCKNCNIKKSNK